jgi:hypothetical protein
MVVDSFHFCGTSSLFQIELRSVDFRTLCLSILVFHTLSTSVAISASKEVGLGTNVSAVYIPFCLT